MYALACVTNHTAACLAAFGSMLLMHQPSHNMSLDEELLSNQVVSDKMSTRLRLYMGFGSSALPALRNFVRWILELKQNHEVATTLLHEMCSHTFCCISSFVTAHIHLRGAFEDA